MALAHVYKTFNERWCNQTVWICADPHFGDDETKDLQPNRPSDEDLVSILNSFMGKKDTLIVLGDVCDPTYIGKLRPAYKILIKGNHDCGSSNYEPYFNEIYDGPLIIGERLILSHEPIDVPWAFNIHGHNHKGPMLEPNGLNVCLDVTSYKPVHLNKFLKNNHKINKIRSIHKETIRHATANKRRRSMA